MSIAEAAERLKTNPSGVQEKRLDATVAESGGAAVQFSEIEEWFNQESGCFLPENLVKTMVLADQSWFLTVSSGGLCLLGFRDFTEKSLVKEASAEIFLGFGRQGNREIGLKELVLSGAISSGNDTWALDITYRITDYRKAYVAQAALLRVNEGRIINLSDAGQRQGNLFFRDATLAAGEQMSITYGRSGFNQINQRNVPVVDIPMTLTANFL